MSDHNNHEKRRGIRVAFETKIVLRIGETEFHVNGSSKDLSMKGIFISTTEDIPMGEHGQIDVHLSGTTEKFILQMTGKVVRKVKEGVAMEFDSMDLDTYTHLKNIVRYNALDSDDL